MSMKSQRGDTLIEVMIALAIIGAVIGISYATASRALRTGRQAQERTEAYKLVEGQLEQLKLKANQDVVTIPATNLTSDPNSVYSNIYTRSSGTPQSFCLTGGASTITLNAQKMIVSDQYADPSDVYDMAFSATGSPSGSETYHLNCSMGIDNRYKISVERSDTNVGTSVVSVFTVRARWQRIGGGKDEVKIVYRLNRGQFTP